jgi:hypothetical protein
MQNCTRLWPSSRHTRIKTQPVHRFVHPYCVVEGDAPLPGVCNLYNGLADHLLKLLVFSSQQGRLELGCQSLKRTHHSGRRELEPDIPVKIMSQRTLKEP